MENKSTFFNTNLGHTLAASSFIKICCNNLTDAFVPSKIHFCLSVCGRTKFWDSMLRQICGQVVRIC